MEYIWNIQLFAGLPERFGVSCIQLKLTDNQMDAGQLKQSIILEFPEQAEIIKISFLAANAKYCSDETTVNYNDELALLPPVSGGENNEQESLYCITDQSISVEEVLNKVIVKENGATLAFVGTTREFTEGKRTVLLEYEAYLPMAISTMKQIGDEIAQKWEGASCAITHRIGQVGLAEISVVIAVSTAHRDDCYAASRYAIERLKQIVPIWKKEIWEDGSVWKGHQAGPWNPTEALS